MIFIRRRRLFLWLLKAYLKKKGKTIITFFIFGLLLFIILKFSSDYILSKLIIAKEENIGVVGAYTLDNLPSFILSDVSEGLTTLSSDGTPQPGIAKSWTIEENGRVYKFILKNNLYFSDGTNLTSADINLSYKDVVIEKPSPYALVFKLKDSYSPFLVTLSHQILKNNIMGLGNYHIQNISLNGDFVQSISLVANKNNLINKSYIF